MRGYKRLYDVTLVCLAQNTNGVMRGEDTNNGEGILEWQEMEADEIYQTY